MKIEKKNKIFVLNAELYKYLMEININKIIIAALLKVKNKPIIASKVNKNLKYF